MSVLPCQILFHVNNIIFSINSCPNFLHLILSLKSPTSQISITDNGSCGGLISPHSMALTGNWAMCGGRNNSSTIEIGCDHNITVARHLKSQSFGMAYGFDLTRKHRKSSVYKPQLICSAAYFICWSHKVPIEDGFHEFL